MVTRKSSKILWVILVMIVFAALLAAVWFPSAPETGPPPASSPERQDPQSKTVQVLATVAHDPGAYTQGLLWHEGHLYESAGQYGRSTLRRVDPATGEVLSSRQLPPEFFGEGLARVEDRLIQLSWRGGTALVWDREELTEVGRHHYEGEGWGLCFDGHHLVMSDGTSRLTFRDPETFEVVRQIRVVLRDGAVGRLNELECAEGWIYANVYTTDWIVQIDPQSGLVHELIDAAGLLSPEEARSAEVLNGIAYNPEERVFYLTGKLWPKLFTVRFVGAGQN